MPGVSISVSTRSGASDLPVGGTWFVVGQTERGPTDRAVPLGGIADYNFVFGNRVEYGPNNIALYDQVKEFFDEGGLQCYVARIVGGAATTGSVDLLDSSGGTALTLTASSEGGWSSGLTVSVMAGLADGTFRIQLYLNGKLAEDYNNLSNPAGAVTRMSNSALVTVEAGTSTENPANVTDKPLDAGTDDRDALATSDYVAALDWFDETLGGGAVSIPGLGPDAHVQITDHCEANNRIAILSADRGASKADLISLVSAVDSPNAGLFAPWVVQSDGGGGFRAIPPEAYVAACRSHAAATGPWVIPAGKFSQSNALLDVDGAFTITDAEDLDDAGVSIIRKISGSVRLYGYRSLSNDTVNYYFLSIQDLINHIKSAADVILEEFVFAPVDGGGLLLADIEAALIALLDPIATAGGLYAKVDDQGQEVDPGYSVSTGSDVNSAAMLANNTIKALVAIRPSPTAAEVILEIVRVGFTAAV